MCNIFRIVKQQRHVHKENISFMGFKLLACDASLVLSVKHFLNMVCNIFICLLKQQLSVISHFPVNVSHAECICARITGRYITWGVSDKSSHLLHRNIQGKTQLTKPHFTIRIHIKLTRTVLHRPNYYLEHLYRTRISPSVQYISRRREEASVTAQTVSFSWLRC